MKLKDFNSAIDKFLANLPKDMLNIMESNLLDGMSKVETRIIESGKNAQGEQLAPYTPEYLQFKEDVGRYRGHVDLSLGNYSINKRIAAVERRKKRRNKVANAFGQKGRNLKTKYDKHFEAGERHLKATKRAKASATGSTLWRSFGLTEKKDSSGELRVVISPRDSLNKKKASGLSVKRGDFVAMSSKEQNILEVRLNKDFENNTKKYFK